MTRRLRLRVLPLVVLAIVASALPAVAQVYGLPRGLRGVFGSTRGSVNDGQALDIVISVAETYDTDLFVDPRQEIDPTDQRTGGYSSVFIANADYRAPFQQSLFRATLSSETRYFPVLRDTKSIALRAAAGVAATLPGRNTLLVNQSVNYSPSSFNYYVPQSSEEAGVGDVDTSGDYATVIDLNSQYYYDTRLSLTRPVTRRTSLILRGDLLIADFVNNSETRRDTQSLLLRGDYMWPIRRNTSATVGYRYRKNDVRDDIDTIGSLEHSVDVGVSYRPHISASRQALLNVRVGMSAGESPLRLIDLPIESRPDGEGPYVLTRRYSGRVQVGINYPINRDWNANARYERGLTYVSLVEPLQTNRAYAGIEGLLTGRLRLIGAVDLTQGSSVRRRVAYETYSGTLGANYAFTRGLAVYADYQYYFYNFGSSLVDETTPPDLERNTVRVGLALWVPTLQR